MEKFKKSGFSLIEILLVLTVTLSFLVGIFFLYNKIYTSMKIDKIINNISLYTTSFDYFEPLVKNDKNIISLKLPEIHQAISTTTNLESTGSRMVISNSGIQITRTDLGLELWYVPRDVCYDLILKSKNKYKIYSWSGRKLLADNKKIYADNFDNKLCKSQTNNFFLDFYE